MLTFRISVCYGLFPHIQRSCYHSKLWQSNLLARVQKVVKVNARRTDGAVQWYHFSITGYGCNPAVMNSFMLSALLVAMWKKSVWDPGTFMMYFLRHMIDVNEFAKKSEFRTY